MRHAPSCLVTMPLLNTQSPFSLSSSWHVRLKNPNAANSTYNRLPLISSISTAAAERDWGADEVAAVEEASCMTIFDVDARVFDIVRDGLAGRSGLNIGMGCVGSRRQEGGFSREAHVNSAGEGALALD